MTTTTELRRVSFTVAGLPAPQGSKKAMPHRYTGKPFMKEQAGKKLTTWRQDVRAAGYEAILAQTNSFQKPLTGPVGVYLAFTLRRPASKPEGWREWPSWWLELPWRRPDLDKLERAVLDAITGPVLTDDAQVVDLHAWKRYPREDAGPPAGTGVVVTVWQIGEDS